MQDVRDILKQLGLSQYTEAFLNHGFDSWETLCDIHEDDLAHLDVKLGHRRKLQRAIRDTRGHSAPSEAQDKDATCRNEDSFAEGKPAQPRKNAPVTGVGEKRKYQRHPKPDKYAPERAPSAYVLFSHHVRENLKGRDLSFTDIAKIVGEKWQSLPLREKEGFEQRAAVEKERYYSELADYKKTAQYEQYQAYLVDFREKHTLPRRDGKRTKLDTQESMILVSTRSSSQELADRRRISTTALDSQHQGSSYSESNPTSPGLTLARIQTPTASTNSPTGHGCSTLSSRNARQYSSMSASPTPSVIRRDTRENGSTGSEPYDRERQHEYRLPNRNVPASRSPIVHGYAATTTSLYLLPVYQNAANFPPRRSHQEPINRPPPLLTEDTTLSSTSGHSSIPYPMAHVLPPVDAIMKQRILPQPVPTTVPSLSPLDHRPSSEARSGIGTASWPALLRAGEIFRDIDLQNSQNPPERKELPPRYSSAG